jgi:uncharacterized membrane protein
MMGRWTLQPILDSYLLVGLIALGLVLTLFWPLYRRLTRPRRATLLVLRGLVLLLVVLAMLRPTHIRTSTRPQAAVLVVLFDQSRSMRLPSASGERTRWQTQRDVLQAVQPILAGMGEQLEVKIYGYDLQLEPYALQDGMLKLPDEPQGVQTDIGAALQDAVRRETGKRLAGVVLLGDGAQTALAPRVEVLQAGRELARLGYPLYTVAFGPAGDQTTARDVSIDNLPEKYTAFVKNELQIRGLLRVRGYVNQQIPVELVVDGPDGKQQVLGPVMLTARGDGEQVPVEMNFVPQQVGQYKLTMRAAVQPGELVTKNNQLRSFLTVLEGGLNVLYLEGEYRNEVRFLLRALDSSPDIQVNFDILEQADRRNWPVNLGGALADPKYDAFILGDLDADALGTENLQQLASAVERGKGLLVLGGLHSFGPGGYRGTPLDEVLPVVMGKFERQDFDGPFRNDLHHPGPLSLLPARPHPVMQLAPEADNLEVWKRLPPLQGANRFEGLKENPSVRVIGESEQGVPLLIASEYVRGRVLAMAGDSTWLWVMKGHEAEHKRFWRQIILWLVRRDDLNQDNVWIKLEQRRYRQDSRVIFTTGAKSSAGDPIVGAKLELEVTLPDGSRQALPLSAEGDHYVGAVDAAREAGDYWLEARASLAGRPLGTARADFQVLDEDLELSNPAADPDQLARLARLTEPFDGRPVPPERLAGLLSEIQRRPPEVEVEVQNKWQLGTTTLDGWLFLLLLCALLGSEWALRKKWGLV